MSLELPPWYDDLRAANISNYIQGMRYIGIGALRGGARNLEPEICYPVPDLEDRATFLLCLDILRQRLKATTIVLPEGDAYGPWAILHWEGEGTRHHIGDGAAGSREQALEMLARKLKETAS
jgi:hypothetical protein